jgi:hypothetical protein
VYGASSFEGTAITLPEDGNKTSIRNDVFFEKHYKMDRVQNMILSSALHYRQNPLDDVSVFVILCFIEHRKIQVLGYKLYFSLRFTHMMDTKSIESSVIRFYTRLSCYYSGNFVFYLYVIQYSVADIDNAECENLLDVVSPFREHPVLYFTAYKLLRTCLHALSVCQSRHNASS